MAISCDYRIMASGPYKIGLNETLLVRNIAKLRKKVFIF